MIEVGNKFEIQISRWKDSRKFRMQVECIYVSEQVLRFKVSAKEKEMIMEKLLKKKTYPWKISKMNFKFEGDDESVAMSILKIQDEIEIHINPPTKKNWYKA